MCLRAHYADYADYCGHPRPSWAVNVLVTMLGELVALGVPFVFYYAVWRLGLAVWDLLG